MRLIVIDNSDYNSYEILRDKLYKEIPYAIVHIGYSKLLKRIVINFWDSDYIPNDLKKYILKPSNKSVKK